MIADMSVISLTLLLLQSPIPPGSYANPATAELVARARAARERNERLVTAYTANVSQRVGVGIRALSRDRMLFREELAAKIAWKRDERSTITVTGARRALPAVKRKEDVPEDLDASVKWLVVNPGEDHLAAMGDDADGFVYPLREGGEADYTFAIGDTTTITLPSGKRITLLRLDVEPRRSDWRLMSGSLWFDADGYGLVRAVFRPARPYDLRRDADEDDLEDVPSWVNVKAEIRFVTLEYGLYEDRWWMLRYMALDGVGTAGSWLNVPLRFERVYSDYEVEGGTPRPEGSRFRPAGTWRDAEPDSALAEERRARRDSLRAERRACAERAGTREEARRCRSLPAPDPSLLVVVPDDTLSLLESPELGPPILDMGDLITESELHGLADAIRRLPGAPRGRRLELPRGVSAVLEHARYNRVEALSLGIGGTYQSGNVTVDALGRAGFGDGVPNGELGATLTGRTSKIRLGAYRRLTAVNPDTKPFGAVNSTWAALFQRDDGDYFRSYGLELTGRNAESGWWSWRLYAERQRPAAVETDLSVPHLFDDGRRFRPNVTADRADQIGGALAVRGNEPLSERIQIGGEATFEGGVGDFQWSRSSATVRTLVTPSAPLALALEASAGTSTGTVPVQSRFYLGGPGTLRGYTGAVIAGESYWRGRLEVGNAFPAARITVFSDIGWAGPRGAFLDGRPLIGSGVGASFLDGLVRLDLARAMRSPTGWRFDLYFDGRL